MTATTTHVEEEQQLRAQLAGLRGRIEALDRKRFGAGGSTGADAARLNEERRTLEAEYGVLHRRHLSLQHLLNPGPPAPKYFIIPRGLRP